MDTTAPQTVSMVVLKTVIKVIIQGFLGVQGQAVEEAPDQSMANAEPTPPANNPSSCLPQTLRQRIFGGNPEA